MQGKISESRIGNYTGRRYIGFEESEVGERLSKHDGYFSEGLHIRRHTTATYTYLPLQAEQNPQLRRKGNIRKATKFTTVS